MTRVAGPPDVSMDVARRAVEWAVELEANECDGDQHRLFQRWYDSDEAHRRAWRHIQDMQARLKETATPAGAEVARSALLSPRGAARRDLIKSLMVVFFAGAAWTLTDQRPWREWTADLRTGTGERRTLSLSDGTRLVLNTDSAVNVRYDHSQRRLDLIQGEVLVETAPDARPMRLVTGRAHLRPLGTRFAVLTGEHRDQLDVLQGAVEVAPVGGGRPLVVNAGQRTWFSGAEVAPAVPLPESGAAWVQGMLVVDGLRLADFLAELGRYRPGYLGCDPAIADWHVSGTFPLDDTDRVLRSLAHSLPVHVHYVTRYWVRVGAAQQ